MTTQVRPYIMDWQLADGYTPYPDWQAATSKDRIVTGAELAQLEAQFSAAYDVSPVALRAIKRRLAAEQKALKIPVVDAPKRVKKLKLCDHCQCALTEAA